MGFRKCLCSCEWVVFKCCAIKCWDAMAFIGLTEYRSLEASTTYSNCSCNIVSHLDCNILDWTRSGSTPNCSFVLLSLTADMKTFTIMIHDNNDVHRMNLYSYADAYKYQTEKLCWQLLMAPCPNVLPVKNVQTSLPNGTSKRHFQTSSSNVVFKSYVQKSMSYKQIFTRSVKLDRHSL